MASSNPYSLTDLQYAFVREYLVDFNATAAYQRAGYKANPQAARRAASRLLTNVDVQAALAIEVTQIFDRMDVTPQKVVKELARLGFSDMRRFADWDRNGVRLKASTELDDDDAAAVAEVSEETRQFGESTVRTVKFKLHSKMDGLNGLAKYLDLYGEAKALGELGQGLAALLSQAKHANAAS